MSILSATASFVITESTTVPADYRWDDGIPMTTIAKYDLITNDPSLVLTSTNSSGVVYAGRSPFANITLSSSYTPHPSAVAVKRVYDFGDYYNSESNIVTTTCFENEQVCHVYIMPGTYTIKMTVTEYRLKSTLLTPTQTFEQQPVTNTKPDIFWQWRNFLCNGHQNPLNKLLKWNSGECQTVTWREAIPCLPQPICTWNSTCETPETECSNPGPQKPNIDWTNINCNDEKQTWERQTCTECVYPAPEFDVATTTYIKEDIVTITELPPVAFIENYSANTNIFPYTTTFSARNIQSGSFPIERIDWDFGDGSPIQTIRRNTRDMPLNVAYNETYSPDYKDPRNYDITHTYQTAIGSDAKTFYPSLTCYTSSTAQTDCVKTLVGPIFNFSNNFENDPDLLNQIPPVNVNLLQNELNDYGRLLMAEIDNTLVVWRYDK
jgi:hypothetical protein